MSAPEEAPGAARERRVLFDEEDARAVLLARAVEEADPRGRVLPHDARERASDEARAELGEDASLGRFLAARARRLAPRIAEAGGPGERLLAASSLGLRAGRVVLVALVLGLATNLLGPERGINVLANPIVALLAWNLLVYVALAAGVAARAARRGRSPGEVGGRLPALVAALQSWRLRRRRVQAEEREAVLAAATTRYLAAWRNAGGALLAARVRRAFHLGAAVLVLGALAGTYARGLLFEYRVVWESTFLGPRTVDRLLGALLGPASALSGIEVPSVSTFRLGDPGPAAPWIHLFAITAGLVVLLPRAALAAGAALRARRLARGVAVDPEDPYFRRLAAALRGKGVEAEVVPYSYRLEPRRAEALKRILHDALGARARIVVRDTLPYGEEPEAAEGEHGVRVVVFNLAQTPEPEVHARAAAQLAGGPVRALALVDASAWRERTAGSGSIEVRIGEHRRTWDRMLRESRVPVVHLDLDRPEDEGLLGRIEEALAPRETAEAAP